MINIAFFTTEENSVNSQSARDSTVCPFGKVGTLETALPYQQNASGEFVTKEISLLGNSTHTSIGISTSVATQIIIDKFISQVRM